MNRFGFLTACALLAGACRSSTTPTPPPTEDPPKITCPVVPPIQLTSGTSIAVTFAATTVNGKAPVVIACAPLSGSPFNVGTTSVSCTAADALQRADTCSFAIAVLAVVPPPTLGATRFFAFGDSITAGEDGSNPQTASTSRFYPRVILPAPQTYPGVLLSSLADRYKTQSLKVDNEGKPAEAVTEPGTLGRFVTFTSSGQYDAALIMEGTNDVYQSRNGGGTVVLEVAAAGLRRMVGDAKSRNIRPFLATIPPIDPSGFRGMVYGAELVPGLNDRIRSIAAAENVPLVDVYQAFGGNLALLSADGVHPNPEGYTKIAGAFFDAIKSTLEIKTSSTSSFRRR